MHRTFFLSALQLFSWLISASSAQPAAWMSGKWGVGIRTPGGGIAPPVINNLYVPYFNVSALVNQVKSMGASWLIINLSSGASGDTYISYHPVLYEINPGSTPANTSNGGRDLFGEIATALQSAGIACIAYIGAEGPAMLKAGPTKAYDYNNVTGSASVTNWINWVQFHYGSSNTSTLKIAYANEIVSYYATRYGNLVDGWWFDQSNFADIPRLHSVVKAVNPNVVAMFNDGDHVPLYNSQPGLEDATAGTPTPLRRAMPNSMENYPIITSVEESNGWLKGPNGELALGHVFMPFGDSWNAIRTQNVWNLSQAVDWMGRVLRSGGAWTWNLPRQSNVPTLQPDASIMSNEIVNFTKSVVAALSPSATNAPTSIATILPTNPPTWTPTSSPTANPTTTPTSVPSLEPSISPSFHPTTSPTSLPTSNPTVFPTNQPTFSPTVTPIMSPPLYNSTASPTGYPTFNRTMSNTAGSTTSPTSTPTMTPAALSLSSSPTASPTSKLISSPTSSPTASPTSKPTSSPTLSPTSSPTPLATFKPASSPTSLNSSFRPSFEPTLSLVLSSTSKPTLIPTSLSTNPMMKSSGSTILKPTLFINLWRPLLFLFQCLVNPFIFFISSFFVSRYQGKSIVE